jgi:hypothetical protein
MYYHADREEPPYYPPVSPELEAFAHRGTFDTRVNMHIQVGGMCSSRLPCHFVETGATAGRLLVE